MSEPNSPGGNDSRSRDSGTPRIRRRNRMITSCLECRRRKLKCDKLHPCTNCSKFSRECMFLAPALDSVSQKKLNELKDKMGSLEKVLENDIARKGNKRSVSPSDKQSSGDLPGEDSGSDEIVIPEDEKPLEPTPLAVTDAAYEDGPSEDLLDLGVRLGRMRLTERFGGFFRPRFAEEVASSLGEPINTDMSDQSVGRLHDHEDFLGPGPTFIAPGSGFIFGDVGPRRNLIDFLPSKNAADALIQAYYRRVHFIARVVHWPSFQLQYESFWNNVLSGYEPQASVQALVFAAWFAAIVSMTDNEILSLFGSDKASILANFQTATEVALGKANYLRTTKIETLQALIVYLLPMVREEISRAHSVLVGSAIRLGECMALHRDPEKFGLSPIGAHVRRILWFQLCWLDFRTSETQAPRCYIKREDYDTRFPQEINDIDLMAPEPKERTGVWTDMSLSRLRFECIEMIRIITADGERLRQKKISITQLLGKIETFRRAMEAKYHPMCDVNIPIQHYAKKFLASSMARMHVAVLHRFHHSVHVQIPDRLREILIINAVEAMENFIDLQKSPKFSDWLWTSTNMTTWNPAMLLLLEIFWYPQRQEADRIWAIIEYVYAPDKHLAREQKARQILRTIRDRVAFYRNMRQIREPVNMPSQALAVRMKDIQNGETGIGRILIKKEDTENPLQDGTNILSTPSSRKTSLNGAQHSPVTNAAQTKQPENESWTFGNSSTLFAPPPNQSKGASPTSRYSSVSPIPPANLSLQPQRSMAQAMSNMPGLDYGSSAGSSPSNSADWPSSMPQDQRGWNMSTLTIKRPSDGSINPQMPVTSSPMGQMSNLYMQQNFPVNQMPFVAGAQHGIEAMLQPSNSGYNTDDTMSLDIDWGEWDKIFPPSTTTGNLDRSQVVAG